MKKGGTKRDRVMFFFKTHKLKVKLIQDVSSPKSYKNVQSFGIY